MERLRRIYRGAKAVTEAGGRHPVALGRVAAHTMVPTGGLIDLHKTVTVLNRRGVPGCLVETGVWRGGAAALMALADGRERHIHLFDSFEGLPQPSRHDENEIVDKFRAFHPDTPLATEDGELVAANACIGDHATAEWLMNRYAPGRHTIHPGWFEDTVPEAAKTIGPIAVLRLDGDLYQSTKVCLDHLYPLLSPGGSLIIDDYGAFEGCRKAVDEYFGARRPPLAMVDATIARTFKAA